MPAPEIAATRVYRNHHLDSTRWEAVPLRAGDIVVTTPYKCGTTWMQRILAALVHGPGEPLARELSPWVDARFWGPVGPIAAAFDAQAHRRFAKSHLPLDGMVWDEGVTYIVVGRDPRDVFMSLLNHYGSLSDGALAALNDEGNPGDPFPAFDGDVLGWWRRWIAEGWFDWECDGWPYWSAFHHWETWWPERERDNVVFVHYADLLADLLGEIGQLTAALGMERSPAELEAVAEVATFATMKRDFIAAEAAAGGPDNNSFFKGGMATFINKGTNGRWRDVLSDAELAGYEARAALLDPGLRRWLEGGRAGVDFA